MGGMSSCGSACHGGAMTAQLLTRLVGWWVGWWVGWVVGGLMRNKRVVLKAIPATSLEFVLLLWSIQVEAVLQSHIAELQCVWCQ